MSPVEKIPMGRTTKSLEELRAFLRTNSSRFTASTYDLFRNNCNNFTNEVATFLLGTQIPDRILRVPEEVLSTPMGQSIGAMWGNMQSNMGSRMGSGGAAWDPFTGGRGVPTGAAAPVAAPAPAPAVAAPTPALPSVMIANAKKPLVSAEPGNIVAVIDRLKQQNEALPHDSPHRLSAEDLRALDLLPAALTTTGGPSISPALPSASTVTTSLRACNILTKCLRTWPRGSAAFPVLSLIRLLVLRDEAVLHLSSTARQLTDASAASGQTLRAGEETPEVGVLWDVLETVSLDPNMYGSVAPNIMALSVLANTFKTPLGLAWALRQEVATKLIEVAVRDIHAEKKEIRQMAAALAFNLCNSLPVGSDTIGAGGSTTEGDATVLVTDASVQLLGSLLDAVDTEDDAEAQRRRLLGAGRLIEREGPAAAELVATLGFGECIQAIASNGKSSADAKAIANELLATLKPVTAF
jgi:hypothetical protein